MVGGDAARRPRPRARPTARRTPRAAAAAARTSRSPRAAPRRSSSSTRWCGQTSHVASTPRARAAATRATPAPVETCTTCSAQPVSSARCSARAIASVSATTGREARKSRTPVRPGARARAASPAVIASLSACTATGRPSRAARAIPSWSVRSSARGKSSMPLAGHERLEPDDAARRELVEPVHVPGHEPAPEREVARRRTRRRPRPSRRTPRRRRPAGVEFSGMSTAQVTPPTASAAVPVAMPSHSVRPGSLRCTCGSTPPGSTCRPGRVDRLGRVAAGPPARSPRR